jgi:hypothetical protein
VLIQRRVLQTLPIIVIATIVGSLRIVHNDPWRSNTVLGWLGSDVYYPRNLLFAGDEFMSVMSEVADMGIWAGCCLTALAYLLHRRHSLSLNPDAVKLIGVSFGAVGLTHLVNVFTMYSGIYLLDLVVRSSAAAACCVTAAYTARELLSRARR